MIPNVYCMELTPLTVSVKMILPLIQCFYGNILGVAITMAVIPLLCSDWPRAGAVATQQPNQSVAHRDP